MRQLKQKLTPPISLMAIGFFIAALGAAICFLFVENNFIYAIGWITGVVGIFIGIASVVTAQK